MIVKLFFLALVGISTAYQYSYQNEFYYGRPDNKTGFEYGAWEPNRQYVYNITSKTMTALPDLENQYTGTITRAYLVLRPKNAEYVFGYIKEPEYAVFNQYLPQGYSTEFRYLNLQWRPMPMSSKPFAIRYYKGAIKGFYVDQSVPNHEVNILKAWISQFQLDTRGAHMVKSKYNQFPGNNSFTGVYEVMEPVVTGECKTLYDVSVIPPYLIQANKQWVPQPQLREKDQFFFQVVKTQNFDQCKQRMGYHFGFTGYSDFRPNTNQMGNVASKSAVSNMYFTGSWYNYTIQSSTTVNKVAVAPTLTNKDKAIVYAAVNVTLNRVENYPQVPVGPAEDHKVFVDMVYSYNMPSDKKNTVRPGNSTESSSSSSSSSSSESSSSSSSSESSEDNPKVSPVEQYKAQLDEVEKRGNRNRRDLNAYKEKKYYEAYKMDQYRLSRKNDTSSDSSSSDDSSSSSSSSSESREHKNGTFSDSSSSSSSSSSSDSSSSSSSSESDSLSSEEFYYQPAPESFKEAPQTPFLPYFTGYKGYNVQYARNVDGQRAIYKLVQEVADELQNPSTLPKSNTLSKFNIVSRIFRTMNYQDIYDIAQKYFVSQKERKEGDYYSEKFAKHVDSWYFVRDALAEAGTPPAFKVIKEFIEEKKLRGFEAAGVFSTFAQSIRYPTESLLHEFFLLATSDTVQHQEGLNTTALFTYTYFVNQAQVNNRSAYNYYPVYSFGRLADADYKIVSHKIVPWLSHQLREAIIAGDSIKAQVYIRCLGNLGHPEILNVFEPYLEGKYYVSDFQRLAMVAAFDHLIENYPELARAVLFKIYQNIGDVHQIRCAAVHMLMRAHPPADMLQRMAEYTHYDPSRYVRAAVKTALESAAEAYYYDYDNYFAENAKAAIKFLSAEDFSFQYSSSYIRDYAFENLNLAYRMYYGQVAADDHYMPNGMFFQLRNNFGGFKKYTTFYYLFSSMESFFDLIDKQYDSSYFKEDYKSADYYYKYYKKFPNKKSEYFDKYYKFHGPQSDYYQKFSKSEYNDKEPQKYSTTRIAKLLNIDPKEAEELEGQFMTKFFNAYYFYAFNNQTIENAPQYIKQWFEDLEDGWNFNFTKFYQQQEASLCFPLATGFPFVYTLKTPTVFKFETQAQAKTYPSIHQTPTGHPENENDDFIYWPKVLNGSVDVNLLYHRMEDAKVGFVTPFDHQRYIAGYQKKFFTNLPFNVELSMNFESNEYDFEFAPLKPKEDQLFFHISSWPYTGYKDITEMRPVAENPNFKIVHDDDQSTKYFEHTFGQDMTGFALRFHAKYDQEFFDFNQFYEFYKEHDFYSAFFYPFATQPYEYHQFNVYYDAQRTDVEKIKFSVHYKEGDFDQDFQESDVKHSKGRYAYSGYYNEANYAQPIVFSAASQRRQEQFIKNAAAGIRNSDVGVFDFGFTFEGKKQKAEYVFTTAYADSPVDEKSRFLFFFSGSPYYSSKYFFGMPYEGKQFQFCFSATNEFPNVPKLNFMNALNQNEDASVKYEFSYGEKCQGGAQISVKGKLHQSDEYRHYLRTSEVGSTCKEQMDHGYYQLKECQNATRQASYFDQYFFKFDFKNFDYYSQNFTYKFFNYFQPFFYPYYESNYFYKGKSNQAQFNFELAPYADYFNASFFGPEFAFKVENYPFYNYYARYFATVHSDLSFFDRFFTYAYRGQYYPSCAVSSKYITTFDGKYYDYNMGDCWHVLLHTVKPDYEYYPYQSHFQNADYEYRFKNGFDEDEQISILGRSGPNNELYFKVVLGQYLQKDYYIDIIPDGAELPKVFINGKPQQIHEKYAVELYTNDNGGDQPLFRCYALPGKELEISIRDNDLRIAFDGYRARFFADQSYYNNFVGLCGTNNGEYYDEFVTPDQCYFSKPEYFAASYALTGQNCTGPAKAFNFAYQQKAKEECVKKEVFYGNVVYEQDYYRKRYRYYNHNVEDSSSSSSSSSDSSSSSSESNSSSEEHFQKFKDSDKFSDNYNYKYSDKYNYKFGDKFSDKYDYKYTDKYTEKEYHPHQQPYTTKECEVKHQYQFFEQGDQICFSMRPLPACPSHCQATDKTPKYFDVHCRSSEDPAGKLYKSQIQKGFNPDMKSHSVSKTVKFNIPKTCFFSQ